MHAIPADLRLPLPSAVIHVISLAHSSLTFARSVAGDSLEHQNLTCHSTRPPTPSRRRCDP